MNSASAVGICLLMQVCSAAAVCNTAVYDPVASGCPATAISQSESVASESECILRCTLDRECRLSAYVTDSATCYSTPAGTLSVGTCSSGMTVKIKLPPDSPDVLKSLNFAHRIVLLFDFKKSFKNIVDPCRFSAEPVDIAEQNSIDGVRLRGSSSSYLKVSTPGFYKYFNYGQKFSIFFQGKFGMSNLTKKCFSAFVDIARKGMYSSTLHADSNGRISAKFYFPRGEPFFRQWTSKDALTVDSVQRVASIGINFDGQDFSTNAYFNGSAVARSSGGYGPRQSAGSLFTIQDDLLIGNCMTSGIDPFDGWLQCWALLTGNLDTSQFDQLRSLCSN